MGKGKVGIVVVTYNRLELLKGVVESLRNQTYKDFQIIVVNNSSPDGTLDWLKEQKDVHTITQANVGGAGGFFTGMKYVAEHGFDYCWVMDDDVICDQDALQEFFNAEKVIDGDYGFLCSSVINKVGDPCNTPILRSILKEGYPDWPRFLDKGIVRVISSTFVSVFVPVKNIYEYGLPIKEFFIWGDDTEYTFRLSHYKPCYVVGKSKVQHLRVQYKGNSFLDETNPGRLRMYFYMYRNQLYTAKKWGGIKDFPVARCWASKVKWIFKALARLKFKHCWIIIKGSFAALFFNPTVQKPEQ